MCLESMIPCNVESGSGRLVWIDLAKALAAYMVVMSHLIRSGVLTDFLAAFSVGIFFALAGVTHHRHENVTAWAAGLLRRIVLPYLAVGLISIVIYRFLGSYAASRLGVSVAETTLVEDLTHLLYGSSVGGRMKWNESLWFLPCYCLMILLSEIILQIARERVALEGLLYAICGLIGYGMIRAGMIGLPWHLETALLILPLCGLGRAVQRGIHGRSLPGGLTFMSGVLLLVLGMVSFAAAQRRADYGSLSLRAAHVADLISTFGFLVCAAAGFVLIIYAATRGVHGSTIAVLGERSLEIVLWNKFPVLFMQVLLPVVLPGLEDWFVGRADLIAILAAAILAIPCVILCLVWADLYTMAIQRLLRLAGR